MLFGHKKKKTMSEKDPQAQEQPKESTTEQPSSALQPDDLQKQLEKLQAENKELTDKLQRLAADYANYQKRVPRQISDSVEYEKRSLIRSLLPSMDNFALALSGVKTAQGPEGLQSIIEGIKFIYDHFFDALKVHGVERIICVGLPFEPGKHEAIMQKADPEKPDNTVLEEFQAGYLLNGQTLRPAKVVVNKLPALPTPELEEAETTDVENDPVEKSEKAKEQQ
jgi:molecular chaperone GrpE